MEGGGSGAEKESEGEGNRSPSSKRLRQVLVTVGIQKKVRGEGGGGLSEKLSRIKDNRLGDKEKKEFRSQRERGCARKKTCRKKNSQAVSGDIMWEGSGLF